MQNLKLKTLFSVRLTAIFEIAVFFFLTFILDYFFFSKDMFINVLPHPFWIIVILISVQYGTNEGVFAAIVSSIVFIALIHSSSEQEIQDYYTHLSNLFLTPLQWLIASIIVGELTKRHINEKHSLRKAYREAKLEEEKVLRAYNVMRENKEVLEERISGQMRSGVMAYKAALSMNKISSEEVISSSNQLVELLLKPKKFSIFLLDGNKLKLKSAFGWDQTALFKKEFSETSDILRKVIGENKFLTIVNSTDEKILSDQGVLAGPIINSKTREMVGMLKIEEIEFDELNITNIETFKILCQWIGSSYASSKEFERLNETGLYNNEKNIYSQSFFNKQIEFLSSLSKRIGFEASVIILKINNFENLSSEAKKKVYGALDQIIRGTLRKVDQFFEYNVYGEEFAIILPGTPITNAQIVIGKIKEKIASQQNELSRLNINFSVTAIDNKVQNV